MTSGVYKRTPEMKTGKYKRTPEHCAAMSAATLSVPKSPRTPEHCAAISDAHTGIPPKKIKLLKTSMRLEIRGVTGWKKVALVYYKDLEINPETSKLHKIFHTESRRLHEQTTIHR